MDKTLFYVGGCSGSNSPEFDRPTFGTHTTSSGILFGERGIFIDNGTGVARVASYFLKNKVKEVYGLQTHFHSDHRIGIHGNKLLFVPKLVKEIHAPKLCRRSFKRLFEADFSKESWPVCPNAISIVQFKAGEDLVLPFPVKTLRQNHAGGSAGYRISTPSGDVVFSTDSEPVGRHVKKMAEFISGSALFYVDVQYRKGEYDGNLGIGSGQAMPRIGWGHGTPEMLFDVLMKCKVPPKKILVGHHDPARTEGDLFVFEQEVRNLLVGFKSQVVFAREGDTVEV